MVDAFEFDDEILAFQFLWNLNIPFQRVVCAVEPADIGSTFGFEGHFVQKHAVIGNIDHHFQWFSADAFQKPILI